MVYNINNFEQYLKNIDQENDISYIENSKQNELNYMNYHKYRFKKYLELLPKSENKIKILDIGTTPFTFFLKKTFPHYEIYTVDRTDHLKERCKENNINLISLDLDNEQLPYEKNFFDVVIFTEVLEHIFAPPTDILGQVYSSMNKGGLLILSVPNITRLINRLRIILGKTILDHPDEVMQKNTLHGHGHLHEYEKNELIRILNNLGFFIENTEYLQRTIKDAALHHKENKIKALGSGFYYSVTSIIPSFRETILILARK